MCKRPKGRGPASLLVKHSLYKFRFEGTAVRSPLRTTFQTRSIFLSHKFLTGNPTIGWVLPISQPLQVKSCRRLQSARWRGNVTLKNGPMTSSDRVTSYTLLRNTTTNLATYDNNQSCMINLRQIAEILIGIGQDNTCCIKIHAKPVT